MATAQTTITARESPGGPPPGLGQMGTLRWAAKNPPADPAVSFAGKTVLVTGANTGLGFEAALKYARLGADRLILAVRSVDKGEAAKQRILHSSAARGAPRDPASISVMAVDQSEYASVQAFVRELAATISHLDVALLNAGLANPKYHKSSAGWEMAVQVNVLSTALLALLILPLLRKAAAEGRPAAHLTIVNSFGHMFAKEEWVAGGRSLLAVANDQSGWATDKSYMTVKLLGMAIMQALARATSPSTVIINAVCPSLCKTDLGRSFGFIAKILAVPQQAFFARTAEQGARSLVSATALGPESHGRFWNHDILYPFGELAKDEEFMRRTWAQILEVLVKVQADLRQVLDQA